METWRRVDVGLQTKVHRALSNPLRQRLLEILRRAPDPQHVSEIASRLGLHGNTVRSHLAVLVEAGLVACQPEDRDRPGRPRLTYRPVDVVDAGADQGYLFLAEILVSHLAGTSTDPSEEAVEAGTVWGHHLVERPPPFQTIDPVEAIDRVVSLMADFGFVPELDNDGSTPRISLRRCPFLTIAEEHPEIVCGIHLGLMRGALAELGADVGLRDLQPLVEPGLCISHLEVTA